MVKHCCYGTCKNSTRKHGKPEMEGVFFIPFPKPTTQLEKCQKWISLCGRPHHQLNVDKLKYTKGGKGGGRDVYICSIHFVGGKGPTDEYAHPVSAIQLGSSSSKPKKSRHPPRIRTSTPTPETAPDIDTSSPDRSLVSDHDYSSFGATSLELDAEPGLPLRAATPTVLDDSDLCPPLDPFSPPPLFQQREKCKHGQGELDFTSIGATIEIEGDVGPDFLSDVEDSNVTDMDISDDLAHNFERKLILTDSSIQTAKVKDSIRDKFVEKITLDNTSCLFWTGLSSLTLLNYVFEWVQPCIEATPLWMGKKRQAKRLQQAKPSAPRKRLMTHWEEYLLVLMRIRRGLDTGEVATLFDVTPGHVSHVFITWVNVLHKCLGQLMEWPKAEFIQAALPPVFKNLFPTTRVIVDCSELYVQVPRNLDAQKVTYSTYKSHNTFKFLMGLAPSGQITYLSKLYSGSISDRDIVVQSGFLDLIEPNDNIMADRGFNIRDLLVKKKANLNLPAYSAGQALPKKAVVKSRKVASVRIHVERGMKRLKNFHILNGVIPLQLKNSLDQIMTIFAVLGNLNDPLVKQ